MTPQEIFQQALVLHRQGKLAEAEPLYAQVIAAAPDNFPTRYMAAMLCYQQQRHDDALAAVQIALQLRPMAADALTLKAAILKALARSAEALAVFDTLVAAQAGDAAAWYNRAVTLVELGRGDDAIADLHKAVALKPDQAEAWRMLGVIAQHRQRLDEALASYDRALAVNPQSAEVWSNRGTVLMDLKRFEEAVTSLDRALALSPDGASIWHNRGTALRELRRTDEALASFDKALALEPGLTVTLNSRSAVLWKEKRDYAGAVRDLEQLIRIAPDYDYAQGLLLHLKMQAADWTDFGPSVAAVNEGVRAGKRIVQPFVYQAISSSPEELQKCSTLYANHLYRPAPALPLKGNRGHRKIRLGYMSGEMRAQAIGFLMVGVFEHHDRDKFELVVLDNGHADASSTRARIVKAADRLIDITQLSNHAAASRIRDEEIDILINLNGYFGAVRMEIFAEKPAPLQVNYLGLPATLGADYIDYILADRIVIPDAERRFYTESVVHLPDTYWPTDNRQDIAAATPTRAQCGLPESAFVFCNFNQSYKFTPGMFASWCRILEQTPGSVLWLMDGLEEFRQNLRRAAQSHGIAPDRLIFGAQIPLSQHLARLKLADLSLDSLPYNEHTTGCDVLWAGVPLLTCPGTAFPGRVAASMLTALGLPELIAKDLGDYERLAAVLARDPAQLAAIRQKLEGQRKKAPLFDTARFTRNLEAAYTQMWARWLKGQAPSALSIDQVISPVS